MRELLKPWACPPFKVKVSSTYVRMPKSASTSITDYLYSAGVLSPHNMKAYSHYREYYTPEDRKFVEVHYACELESFGYEF